ncbi:MAG: hypothetical protein RL701_2286 [Pseudomonadota bacterium]
MQIIRNGAIVEDAWVHVADGAELPADGDVIVSLDRYLEQLAVLRQHAGQVGVRLRSDQEAKQVAPYAATLKLIAIEFPVFKDGRGYSTGRLLRERFAYAGELRAVGDVLRDQLFYLKRCGFDTYELKAGKDIQGALEAFRDFSVTYQGAADDPRPLFRRRAQAAKA